MKNYEIRHISLKINEIHRKTNENQLTTMKNKENTMAINENRHACKLCLAWCPSRYQWAGAGQMGRPTPDRPPQWPFWPLRP